MVIKQLCEILQVTQKVNDYNRYRSTMSWNVKIKVLST